MELRPSTGCRRPHEQRVAINRGGESLPRPEAGAFGDLQVGCHARDEQRRAGGPHREERAPPRRNTCARHRVTVPGASPSPPEAASATPRGQPSVVSNSASTDDLVRISSRALPEVRRAVRRRERELRGPNSVSRPVACSRASRMPGRCRDASATRRVATRSAADARSPRLAAGESVTVSASSNTITSGSTSTLTVSRSSAAAASVESIGARTLAIRSASASAAPGAASRIASTMSASRRPASLLGVAAPHPCRAAVHVIQCLPQRGRLAVPGTGDQDDAIRRAGRPRSAPSDRVARSGRPWPR